jgi:hypothetical protein
MLKFAIRAFHRPSLGAMSFLACPQLAFVIARVIIVYQFGLNAIPSTQQSNRCHIVCSRRLVT